VIEFLKSTLHLVVVLNPFCVGRLPALREYRLCRKRERDAGCFEFRVESQVDRVLMIHVRVVIGGQYVIDNLVVERIRAVCFEVRAIESHAVARSDHLDCEVSRVLDFLCREALRSTLAAPGSRSTAPRPTSTPAVR